VRQQTVRSSGGKCAQCGAGRLCESRLCEASDQVRRRQARADAQATGQIERVWAQAGCAPSRCVRTLSEGRLGIGRFCTSGCAGNWAAYRQIVLTDSSPSRTLVSFSNRHSKNR
jgi:hypothetical protein